MTTKGFASILIVGLVFALSGLAVTVYLKQNQNFLDLNQPSPISTFSPRPSTQASPVSSQNETGTGVTKTKITLSIPGKYSNDEYGYTFEFPEDWDLYSSYDRGSKVLRLYHPKCEGQDLVLPGKTESCTSMSLPYFVGDTGWGYGNNKQVEEKVTLKDGTKADKTTFYYDDYIEISWQINKVVPVEGIEGGATLVGFAIVNESYTPNSLLDVDKIIRSISFD